MKAYVIVRVEIEDPSLLKDYQALAPGAIEKYNGKIIVRGGTLINFEGPEDTRRTIIIEFPSLADTELFYNSAEYTDACKAREGIGKFEIFAIEGLA